MSNNGFIDLSNKVSDMGAKIGELRGKVQMLEKHNEFLQETITLLLTQSASDSTEQHSETEAV